MRELNEHEQKVQKLMVSELSALPGFPDDDAKLNSMTRAYARFAATEPYRLPTLDHLRRAGATEKYIAECLAPAKWKEGIVPAEWLMDKIADSCKFFPMPIVARKLYCEAGWPTVDGQSASALAEDLPREDGE